MDKDGYAAAVDELGITDAEVARRLSIAGGYTVQQTTLWRIRIGETRRVPPALAAYLYLLLAIKRAGVDATPFLERAASLPAGAGARRPHEDG
ncbi:hypothetical protein [Brevundimonas sp.]|uniref:hypothetical protein n=1 Tax=Brevundimonas sp. TaxID=1871086 RepID=UPI002D317C69|nr:hypothetical protein [Brevundimonas sp.]HYD29224.1 hypothetical protein [Brevundimonas sp.]